jgi:hypothetical protein
MALLAGFLTVKINAVDVNSALNLVRVYISAPQLTLNLTA